MSGLIDSASAVMSASQRRLEVTAENVANVSTAGYKRQATFAAMIAHGNADGAVAPTSVRTDLSQGELRQTGNPLDIAISGTGFFQLRDGQNLIYSRQGQFQLAGDGTVTSPQGFVLQQAGGGDLTLDTAQVTVAANGDITADGQPVARLAIYAPADSVTPSSTDGSSFRLTGGDPEEVGNPELRQGMVEASNVSVGDEMVTMMAALRQAENGAKLVQTYDDLMGRAITTFAESGR